MSNYIFGRKKSTPEQIEKAPKFRTYLTGALPVPTSVSNIAKVYAKLGISDPTVLFPMDGNDTVGDCTCAGAAHKITEVSGMLGVKDIPNVSDILSIYYKLTGGPDTGLSLLDILNYWLNNPILGMNLIGYVAIDPKNHNDVMIAQELFGGLYIGFNVQENAITDFENGTTWTPGTLTGDGHCVVMEDSDKNGVTVLTWGNIQKATWGWNDECVEEIYALIFDDTLIIDGLDLNTLIADAASIGIGSVVESSTTTVKPVTTTTTTPKPVITTTTTKPVVTTTTTHPVTTTTTTPKPVITTTTTKPVVTTTTTHPVNTTTTTKHPVTTTTTTTKHHKHDNWWNNIWSC